MWSGQGRLTWNSESVSPDKKANGTVPKQLAGIDRIKERQRKLSALDENNSVSMYIGQLVGLIQKDKCTEGKWQSGCSQDCLLLHVIWLLSAKTKINFSSWSAKREHNVQNVPQKSSRVKELVYSKSTWEVPFQHDHRHFAWPESKGERWSWRGWKIVCKCTGRDRESRLPKWLTASPADADDDELGSWVVQTGLGGRNWFEWCQGNRESKWQKENAWSLQSVS